MGTEDLLVRHQAVSGYKAVRKLLVLKEMVGANGFEPSTSWSRTRHLNPINALFGVAYGTRSVISPLSVVPNLYLAGSKIGLKLGPRSEPFGAFSGRFSFGERQGGQRVRQIFREELFWFDDAQSPYLTKVPFVEGGYLAPALQSRCPDNQVIEANHFSGGLQFGPDTCMLVRSLLGVGDNQVAAPAEKSADGRMAT